MAYVDQTTFELFVKNLTPEQKSRFLEIQCATMNDFIDHMEESDRNSLLDIVSSKQRASLSRKQITYTKKIGECESEIQQIDTEIEEHQQKIANFHDNSHKYTPAIITSLTNEHLTEIQQLNTTRRKFVRTLESYRRKLEE
jgi:signal recognition particle GTPase